MQVGAYAIQNTLTGKCYVGSTANFRERWLEHKRTLRKQTHWNSHLQAAWNLYGEEVFKFWEMGVCPEEQRLEREQYWIDRIGGYNKAPAEPARRIGMKDSEATRAKKAAKIRANPPHAGHRHSAETRARISAIKRAQQLHWSAEERQAISSRMIDVWRKRKLIYQLIKSQKG